MIEAHDNEVICLAYSPLVADEDSRYWLASGSRDKNILIFDSKNNYEAVGVLEQHSSTITSIQFNQNRQGGLDLVSGSADRTIVQKSVDLDAVRSCATFEDLQLLDNEHLFRMDKKETCKNKVFSMGIAEKAQYMVTGH